MTTATELESAIGSAIAAKDVPAVGALLAELAAVDPDRAQVVFDTLRLGVELARRAKADDIQSHAEGGDE